MTGTGARVRPRARSRMRRPLPSVWSHRRILKGRQPAAGAESVRGGARYRSIGRRAILKRTFPRGLIRRILPHFLHLGSEGAAARLAPVELDVPFPIDLRLDRVAHVFQNLPEDAGFDRALSEMCDASRQRAGRGTRVLGARPVLSSARPSSSMPGRARCAPPSSATAWHAARWSVAGAARQATGCRRQ